MLKTMERVNLIQNLHNYNVNLDMLETFKPETLLRFCASLQEKKTPDTWYAGQPEIQKELIRDERFFFYLPKIAAAIKETAIINAFLNTLHENGETATDYPVSRLISSMAMTPSQNVFFDYLKHFSDLPTDKKQKEIIINNLTLYHKCTKKPISELPEEEKAMLKEACLNNDELVPSDIERVLTMLTQQSGLLDVIRFFYENKFDIVLNMNNYENFSKTPEILCEKLKTLCKQIGIENMNLLMNRWIENGCPRHDIDFFIKNHNGLSGRKLKEKLISRSGYIDFIYGNKMINIPLSELPPYKEEVLIYAAINKKNNFIRLIEENYQKFAYLGPYSLLFRSEFYSNFVNLNTLNAKNLDECAGIDVSKILFHALEPGRVYTFNELTALYDLPEQYYKLYAGLKNLRVDDRIIIMNTLKKYKLMETVTEDKYISILAEKLSELPLAVWRDKYFHHIKGLQLSDVIELLIHKTDIEKFIPQMKTHAQY